MFMLEKLNLHNGIVTYNEFKIDLSKSVESQIDHLQQDLLQIKYGSHYLIDVGWVPSPTPKGFFAINVIESCDWDNPLLKLKVKKFDKFIESLQEAIDFLDKLIKENPNRPIRKNP